MNKQSVTKKYFYKTCDKYDLCFNSSTDKHENITYWVYPFIEDTEQTRHGLTPCIPVKKQNNIVSCVLMNNDTHLRNFRINKQPFNLSITDMLKLIHYIQDVSINIINTLYYEYVSEYLTIETFANEKGLTPYRANQIIKAGQLINEGVK